MTFTKTHKVIAIIIGGTILVLGLLWFFQQQGFVKVFPTGADRQIRKALVIDESKFRAPNGVSVEEFQKAIREVYARRDRAKQSPYDAQAWFSYGYQLEFLNDHEGSVRAWEIALKLQPQNFVVAGNMAGAYQYFLKDYGRAEFYYQQALKIQPDYTAAWQGLGDLYRYNWKDNEAKLEPTMLLAAKNDPTGQSAYFSILVAFFAEKGDLAKAKDYLARVQSLNPKAAQELIDTYPNLAK